MAEVRAVTVLLSRATPQAPGKQLSHELSYTSLHAQSRQLFRRLGLLEAPVRTSPPLTVWQELDAPLWIARILETIGGLHASQESIRKRKRPGKRRATQPSVAVSITSPVLVDDVWLMEAIVSSGSGPTNLINRVALKSYLGGA